MSEERKAPHINQHFRREGKLMLWWLLGVPVVLVALAALLAPYVAQPPKSLTQKRKRHDRSTILDID